MQPMKQLLQLLLFFFPLQLFAQSSYFNYSDKDNRIIDRLGIKYQQNTNINFSGIKPFNRKYAVQEINRLHDSINNKFLTASDCYNIEGLLMNNIEWVEDNPVFIQSKKSIGSSFYKTKTNFFEVDTNHFFLTVNPVLYFSFGNSSLSKKSIYLNTRGFAVRGLIGKKVGFFTYVAENQERGPIFYQQNVRSFRAVPGVGFYKLVKEDSTAFDYFDGRGYITFNAAKYFDFQIGYDKNFIGNGYRSLFLSDYGNSYLFAKINTKIWKLNYQNIYMELIPQFIKKGDSLFSRKYAAMHHLSINVSKSVNVGLFEGVVFGRKDHFDFQYLNPIIFYRHIEGSVGSPDNAVAGIDCKVNLLHRAQLYGQLLLDEFILSRLKNQPTNWANKIGMQLGAKYIDAFGIKNMDLQLELNRVRPFTYSHNDTIANYTHYNQPLAHPLGANFQELIFTIAYQPFPKWNFNTTAIYYYKGLDSAHSNFGGDIFKNYNTRIGEDGFSIGSGIKEKCLNLNITASYEYKRNLFFELNAQNRIYSLEGFTKSKNDFVISASVRLNINRRIYDQ